MRRDEDPTFFSGFGSAGKIFRFRIRTRIRLRVRPEIEMKKKIYLYFRKVGIKFDIITHHFMLEFVDSDLYFVQDKDNFINPLLQVGSGSVEKKYRIWRAKNHRIRPDPDPHPWSTLEFIA